MNSQYQSKSLPRHSSTLKKDTSFISLPIVQPKTSKTQKQDLPEWHQSDGNISPSLQNLYNTIQQRANETEEKQKGEKTTSEKANKLNSKRETILSNLTSLNTDGNNKKHNIIQQKIDPRLPAWQPGGKHPSPLLKFIDTTRVQTKLANQSETTNISHDLPIQCQEETLKAENKTGLPDHLKNGIENLSGYDLSDVHVNYNSLKPAQVNALAYTQGNTIEVASGQEQHLPHEAWHVVQQKQNRVKEQFKVNGVGINDNQSLEHEADVMSAKAIQKKKVQSKIEPSCDRTTLTTNSQRKNYQQAPIIQRTTAKVSLNNKLIGIGFAGRKEKTTGGVNHAEQKSWNSGKNTIKNNFENSKIKNIKVEFEVDQLICKECMDWFEKTAYNYLQTLSKNNNNKEFSLVVTNTDTLSSVTVNGQGNTHWTKDVGEEVRYTKLEKLKQQLEAWGGYDETMNSIYIPNSNNSGYDEIILKGKNRDEQILALEQKIISAYNIKKELQSQKSYGGDFKDLNLEDIENRQNKEKGRKLRFLSKN